MLSDQSRFEPEGSARSRSERSVAGLLSDLASETGMLVRQEIALFKAELREKLGSFGLGAGLAVAGGLVAFSGWLVLLACAVLGLSHVVAPWLAALIVAVVVLALGAGLMILGKRRLNAEALVPRRTLNSLREDEEWIREQFS